MKHNKKTSKQKPPKSELTPLQKVAGICVAQLLLEANENYNKELKANYNKKLKANYNKIFKG